LEHWQNVLNNAGERVAGEVAVQAGRDAEWALDPKQGSDAETKAKARYILGLAEWYKKDYARARDLLTEAAPGPDKASDPAWKKHARRLVKELADPETYYQRYEMLRSRKQLDLLVEEISAALKVSKQQGSLLALRSLARLEMAVASGKKLDANSPAVAAARKDAEAAVEAKAEGEGNYALGRLAEELGNTPAAVKHYKLAVAKYRGQKKREGLYRLALARVLLRGGPAKAEEKKESDAPEKKARAPRRQRRGTPAALVKQALPSRSQS